MALVCAVTFAAWFVATAGAASADSATCPATGMVTVTSPITVANDVATVGFTVAPGCSNVEVSLVSYEAPSATYSDDTADQQTLFQVDTQSLSAGAQSLSVPVPPCFFQVDFVYGTQLNTLGPAGSNNFYNDQGRLIQALNGGTTACTGSTTSTITPLATPAPVVGVTLTKLERVGTVGAYVLGPVTAHVGDVIYYELVVTDTGNVMVTATVQDPGCDPGTLSPSGGQGIGPTGTAVFTCSHTVTATDGNQFVNYATATGTAGNGVQATDTASATAQVVAVAPVGGVAGATKTIVKVPAKVSPKAHPKKKTAVKAANHTKKKVVTKKAKPARAVVAPAHFTG